MSSAGRAATAAAAVSLLWTAPALANLALRRGHRGARRQLRDTTAVALTFDDGPQPHETAAMLRLLEHADVRATFFVVAEHALEYPDLVREMTMLGHSVQCHGFRHVNHLLRNPLGIVDDMRRARDAIEAITDRRTPLYRPPQGVVTWPTLAAAERLFDATVLWAHWGRDWRAAATPRSIADEVSSEVRGGDVLLLHDADWYGAGRAAYTRLATQTVIDRVRDRGLSLVTLDAAAQLA
jgi:peptidoglycan/xylan/chitin deacetylase (PgdA/CDA1 family)